MRKCSGKFEDSWDGTYSFDDIVDQLLCLIDLVFGVGHDQTVKVFLLVTGMSCVRSAFSFFHGAFATNGNLGTGLAFHLLEGIATRTDEETDFVERGS